jgi:hypothetical protein
MEKELTKSFVKNNESQCQCWKNTDYENTRFLDDAQFT